MLHAGLDLSRRRLDVCLVDDAGELVAQLAAAPDTDGLRHLARRVAARVRAVIESMNGARFVHDQLELAGWQVAIADAQKVKGLAPLACKTDRIDARVLAELSRRDHPPQQGTGPVLRIAEPVMQHREDGETDVETDEVGQGQRPHGMVGAELEGTRN